MKESIYWHSYAKNFVRASKNNEDSIEVCLDTFCIFEGKYILFLSKHVFVQSRRENVDRFEIYY